MSSYNQSKNFTGNQKANMKDEFDFSPAKDDAYNYKTGINAVHNLMGEMVEPAYMGQKSPMELNRMGKGMSKMAKMEGDSEGY